MNKAGENDKGTKDLASFVYRLPLSFAIAFHNALESMAGDPDLISDDLDDPDTDKKLEAWIQKLEKEVSEAARN